MTAQLEERHQNEQSVHGAVTAADTLTAWLTRLAGIAAGISVLAYLIGWRQASGYYSAIGASWAVGMTDSSSLIRLAAPGIFVVAISAILSVMQIMQGATSAKFRKQAVWAAVISGILMNTSLLNSFGVHVPSKLGNFLLFMGVYVFYFCVGYSVGEIIALLYEDKHGEAPQIIWVVIFIFSFGFYHVPLIYGQTLGQVDLENGFSSKEIAWVNVEEGMVRWRVVSLLGDKFLLNRSESWSHPSIYKIVSSDKVAKIERR